MLVPDEARVWSQAFATCAIEGNAFAIYMTELWNRDRKKYLEELAQFLLGEKEREELAEA